MERAEAAEVLGVEGECAAGKGRLREKGEASLVDIELEMFVESWSALRTSAEEF